LMANGVSRREAARMLGISNSGLAGALCRRVNKKIGKRGAKSCISSTDKGRITRAREDMKKKGLNPTARAIHRKLGGIKNTKTKRRVCLRTVQRAIASDGDEYLTRPKKGTLTAPDAGRRARWGKKKLQEDFDFSSVDSWIDCHRSEMPTEEKPRRSTKSWRKKEERNEPWAQKSVNKYKVPGTNVFGGMGPGASGTGKLMFLTAYAVFNKETCVALFEKYVVPALRREYGERTWTIMVDGDGAFKSDLFKEFCQDNGIEIYDHPSKSPDLAPIENAWNVGEEKIADLALKERKWRNGAARNAANYAAWEKLVLTGIRKVGRSFYGKLIDGMPARVQRMVDNDGWRIKA